MRAPQHHSRSLKAVVLCAGFGTRMGPLSGELPKPAMPFFGRPLIAHTLEWLAGHGVTEAIINLHHLPQRMREIAQASAPSGLRLRFLPEPIIRGTGGALVAALPFLENESAALCVNGDVFTEHDLTALLRAHRAQEHAGTSAVTLLCTDDPAHAPLFGVGLCQNHTVTDFWGKPAASTPFRRVAYTGIQAFAPSFLERLPQTGFACIKEAGWIPWLREGGHIHAAIRRAPWTDLGTPARYLNGHIDWAQHAGRLSGFPQRAPGVFSAEPLPAGLQVHGPATLGPGCRLLGPAVIGPHAHLGAHVTLHEGVNATRAVIWDHAHVTAPVIDAIVGRMCRVPKTPMNISSD